MEMMESKMLNGAFIKLLPKFDVSVIRTGMFVMIKHKSSDDKEPKAVFSAQITATREDELLLRIVDMADGQRYYGTGFAYEYEAGDTFKLYPRDIHEGHWEIWPAKAVIPGF